MFEFTFQERLANNPPFVVALHGRRKPESERWRNYVDVLRRSYRPELGQITIFVVTDGGGPDAAQRKELTALDQHGAALTHVFATDLVTRGIVTALHWLGISIVAHHPSELHAVCKKSGHSTESILRVMETAQADATPNSTLSLIRSAPATNSSGERTGSL